jgi:hypothetical protein
MIRHFPCPDETLGSSGGHAPGRPQVLVANANAARTSNPPQSVSIRLDPKRAVGIGITEPYPAPPAVKRHGPELSVDVGHVGVISGLTET